VPGCQVAVGIADCDQVMTRKWFSKERRFRIWNSCGHKILSHRGSTTKRISRRGTGRKAREDLLHSGCLRTPGRGSGAVHSGISYLTCPLSAEVKRVYDTCLTLKSPILSSTTYVKRQRQSAFIHGLLSKVREPEMQKLSTWSELDSNSDALPPVYFNHCLFINTGL
jgi:hypothetical protein